MLLLFKLPATILYTVKTKFYNVIFFVSGTSQIIHNRKEFIHFGKFSSINLRKIQINNIRCLVPNNPTVLLS